LTTDQRNSEELDKPPTFKTATSVARLRKTWKDIKANLKDELVRDPLDYTAFEAQSEDILRELSSAVRSEQYRPCPTTLIRAAKRTGLTRPLQFLDIADTILIKTCVDLLQPLLHKDLPDCVYYARCQHKATGAPDDYGGWFKTWLSYQERRTRMLHRPGQTWAALADVGNFFPTVSHRALRQLVASKTGAEDRLINLVFFVLEAMTWRPEYCQSRETGLPQENYDVSRTLAYAFLSAVDQRFKAEIDDDRYARWVDDVTVTAETHEQALAIIARFERAVEDVGLFVSSSKCVARRSRDVLAAEYPNENAYLDRVHDYTKGNSTVRAVRTTAFENRLGAFLDVAPADRLAGWDRVLRRYYTQSKRMQSGLLEQYAFQHLQEYPASAPKILDYLSSRPFSKEVVQSLLSYLKSAHNIYEDVEILIWGFLCDSRIPTQYARTYRLADKAVDHFFRRNNFRQRPTQYARGLMALCAYRYGTNKHMDELEQELLRPVAHDPWVVRYGVCVLAGSPEHRDSAFEIASRYEDRPLRRIHSFLSMVRTDPREHRQVLKQHVRAHEKKVPDYRYFPARMLPLVSLPRENDAFRKQWDRHLESVIAKLEETPEPFRDVRSIDFIRRQLSRK